MKCKAISEKKNRIGCVMLPSSEYVFKRSGHVSKNRSLLAAMTNKQSFADGKLSNDEINWLNRRAKDGFGIITTAASHVSENGQGWVGEMGVWSDSHIPGLRDLADKLRVNGAISLVQIFHGGMKSPYDIIGDLPVCPSEMTNEEGNVTAKELSVLEIKQLVADFAKAAKRCEIAGFDGVEIHGAHSYLISQFLGKKTNQRTDEYGGSTENRFRFLAEIIESVRNVVRNDFLISVRISPKINAIGIEIEDSIEVTKMICDMDIDMFHLSCWDVFEEIGEGENMTKRFKKHIPDTIAYASTGSVWNSSDARWLMSQGADFVGVARVAIAYPDWASNLHDESYDPKRPPFTEKELFDADLSPVFVDYMRNWKGFVID